MGDNCAVSKRSDPSKAFVVTLASSGKQFPVAAGQSVLDAARAVGLALPYSCLAGVCGSCKATVLSGDFHYPRNPPAALNAAELARHEALLCQAVPLGDMLIGAREVASVADMPLRRMTMRVADKTLLSDDVARLTLLSARGERLRRLPGQYIDILLEDGRRRAFSVANAPHTSDHIELHVRHVSGGGFTRHVFEEMAIGATLRIEGPLGTFVPREDSERPMLMMAGGSGFAPIKALVEHFLHLGSVRPMTLYWGARRPADLYLRALPERWAREHPQLRFEPVISDADQAGGLRSGLVHEALLEDCPDLNDVDVYMSGPPPMIDAGRRAFVQAGLPEHRLYYDSFDYAPEVLSRILRSRAGLHGN